MDYLLKEFFAKERWEYAIAKGVGKDIRKDQLIQLTMPSERVDMYLAIKEGRYEIAPPHTAQIPKENGEFRTVYVNEPKDRVFLSIANDLLFDLMPETIHPSCKSYLRGTGCGKVVQEASRMVCSTNGYRIGWKADFSKYFDSVPIRFIDAAFDLVEVKYGKSALIDVLRKYYHSDLYFDTDGQLRHKYQSLKQGCSVASWLADVVLYELDRKLSELDGFYVRYSDDTLFIGKDYSKAMDVMKEHLSLMDMTLNPKKVEYLTRNKWFKFLGFSIKGEQISLSKSRIKSFQHEIEKRTIKSKRKSLKSAINDVQRFLYVGDGRFSWATSVLPIVTSEHDIDELNEFVLDCLRAVETGKKKVGGIGYDHIGTTGCIQRGRGRNVKTNRIKTGDSIDGFLSIRCMRNNLRNRALYNVIIASM